MSNIIQIDNLNKSFGSVNAVRNLSFRVKKGELFAFLGINGAGKSTTINIMCGQLTKDSGSVVIDKHDLDEDMDYIKRELGVVHLFWIRPFLSMIIWKVEPLYMALLEWHLRTGLRNWRKNWILKTY